MFNSSTTSVTRALYNVGTLTSYKHNNMNVQPGDGKPEAYKILAKYL